MKLDEFVSVLKEKGFTIGEAFFIVAYLEPSIEPLTRWHVVRLVREWRETLIEREYRKEELKRILEQQGEDPDNYISDYL